MVEQEAVNFEVASSSLAGGAKIGTQPPLRAYFGDSSILRPSQLEPSVRVWPGEPKGAYKPSPYALFLFEAC